jgi:photosystem II stability/assembly factor-like uncharacterized protein
MFWPAVSPFDSNLMFVSCDMNGIYRSTDGGAKWSMLDGRMLRGDYNQTSRVFFHPTDASTVYVWGYGQGMGALRVSHDKGQTWSVLVSNPPWDSGIVTALAIDPQVSTRVLVGTQSGVYLSTDGGKTWKAPALAGDNIVDLYLDVTSSKTARRIFAAAVGGIYRSDDGGATWKEFDSGLPWKEISHLVGSANTKTSQTALYVTITSKSVSGVFEGGVYLSTDSGKSWHSAMGSGINTTIGLQSGGVGSIAQYNWLGADASNTGIVYVAGTGTGYDPPYEWTVYRSANGGKSWSAVLIGDPSFSGFNTQLGWLAWDLRWWWGGPAYGFTVSTGNSNIAMYTNSGEIYVTKNAGKSWTQAYSIQKSGQGAAGPGQEWQSAGLEVTTCWHYYISPLNPKAHYICYTDIGFERSTDGGTSWIQSTTGSPWGNTFYDLAIDPSVSGRLWAAASNQHDIPHSTQTQGPNPTYGKGGVLLSTDGGKTWTVTSNGLPNAPAVSLVLDPKSPATARRLWVAMYGYGVYRSDNGGSTWVQTSTGLGSSNNMNVYQLHLAPSGVLYCSTTAHRNSSYHFLAPAGIWSSSDAGKTWKSVATSLGAWWIEEYAVHPTDPNTLYACTSPGGGQDGGVYKTTDGGKTWNLLNIPITTEDSGDGSAPEFFAVTLHPSNPNIVFVTTDDSGTWLSKDAGATWEEFTAIPFMSTHRMEFNPADDHTLYMTTFGGGVWKVTLK